MALRTSFIGFDTSITDLTPFLHDPVEVLFGVQLGGGTDIASALGYCQQLVERPRESVVVLVSDLFEGGNVELMHRRVAELVASGAQVVVLLALSDDGTPAHDHGNAAMLAQLGEYLAGVTGESGEAAFQQIWMAKRDAPGSGTIPARSTPTSSSAIRRNMANRKPANRSRSSS